MIGAGALDDLSTLKAGSSKRVSSYDRTGGNKDYYTLKPGETLEVCDIPGAGIIRHIWMTMAADNPRDELYLPRKVCLRMYWDGESEPSVQAPIGDFFGMGHGLTRNFSSAPLAMSPEDGRAFNCFFPMPFDSRATITVTGDIERPVKFYFYVDYVGLPEIGGDQLRFHAAWNREMRAEGIDEGGIDNEFFEFGGKNTTGERNYVILNAIGEGHYVGCNLNIHNLRATDKWNWYGEGDDMIFVDGEKWPPSLHGTGTEDYFNTAWCPTQEVCYPYHGIILGGGPNWSGKVSLYRYHILDPVIFRKSIRVTIEHGHNNHRSDDLSSTAYWYQREPHSPYGALPSLEQRMPRPDTLPLRADRMKSLFSHENP